MTDSTKLYCETPNGESIVAMVVHNDQLVIATATRVYTLQDEILRLVAFEDADEDNDIGLNHKSPLFIKRK